MKLTNVTLKNFRSFENLEIPLRGCARVVLVGDNGAGKSSILEAITNGLGWQVARILHAKGSGSPLAENAIRNGKPEAAITLEVEHDTEVFRWTLARTRPGRKKQLESQLADTSRLADRFQTALTSDPENASLPLVAYYPVERVVLDIPIRTRTRHAFEQRNGYDNALLQGVDFRRFFEWFREREDSENESSAIFGEELHSLLKQFRGTDHEQLWTELNKIKSSQRDRQLTAVRSAIMTFMPGFANLRIQRRPLRMTIEKEQKSLDVGQLSQGEKSLIALVGDIARRLAMMNPALHNPLHGEGIVLIDEVDLHLHPRWQRSILGNLAKTFPNVQFILTTHSPIVISQEREICVFVLNDGTIQRAGHTYGLDVNQILLQEMDTDIRAPEIQQKIDNLLDAIQDQRLSDARALLAQLATDLPADHLELTKARLLLRRVETRRREPTEEKTYIIDQLLHPRGSM
ncbi:MAG: AAA family ATPase [Magnetococcales bacterium]|nr:AAA family ATPase [Magnetococcales bacterium]